MSHPWQGLREPLEGRFPGPALSATRPTPGAAHRHAPPPPTVGRWGLRDELPARPGWEVWRRRPCASKITTA